MQLKTVKKRIGTIDTFDWDKIERAIFEAIDFIETCEGKRPGDIANKVCEKLREREYESPIYVEDIQDLIEETFMTEGLTNSAKAFILYRKKRQEERDKNNRKSSPEIRTDIRDFIGKLNEGSKYFRTTLGELVYFRTYSRWIDDESRRETWPETVQRYMDFMQENLGDKLTHDEYQKIQNAILNQDVMPSMRLLQFAGKAARKTNVCAYNCAYIAPTQLKDFAEIMYLSMCGTGVGFSAEKQNVDKLPIIKKRNPEATFPRHVIEDSKEGWCDALKAGMTNWYNGEDIAFDYHNIRAEGERLKTFGGRSSGPRPLKRLMTFTRDKILARQGQKLRPIDVHDIICKIGEVVVSGGVRRSALISLSDLDDEAMRHAKSGEFFHENPQRMCANNSAVYHEKPEPGKFLREWSALIESGNGERGIFNRGSIPNQIFEKRAQYFEQKGLIQDGVAHGLIGTNPCGEIILQSKQFCNLTEVVIRPEDSLESLKDKIRVATLLGTYQATLTNFRYLSDEWRKNCEEERLLGVSLTGLWDNKEIIESAPNLTDLRATAAEANEYWATRFNIQPSHALTCIKPSGTVSQMIDAAPGMHPRHSRYYIRRIRISSTDALCKLLRDQGVPHYPEIGQTTENANTFVFEFPISKPETPRTRVTPHMMFDMWRMLKNFYTDHNPSVTISLANEEWIEMARELYEDWYRIGGLSFLPKDNTHYPLLPFERIYEEDYNERSRQMPDIDFSKLVLYETEDETNVMATAACEGPKCDIQ